MLIQKQFPEQSAFADWKKERSIDLKNGLDRLLGYPRLLSHATQRLGYTPDIKSPKTYNDKVQWRKIHDRNPLFPVIADKIRVQGYLRDTLGDAAAAPLFAKLYQVTDNVNDIDFDALPDSYVIKANHGSGWNILVRSGDRVDRDVVRSHCARWLRRSYGKLKQEWAYQPIPRRIMIEELVTRPDGRVPSDMKFSMFGDTCGMAMTFDDRFGDLSRQIMDEHWQPMPFTIDNLPNGAPSPKPALFDDMLVISRKIGAQFDHIRVDFMYTDTRIVLNELTLYRGSGMLPFDPPEWDRRFGDMWKLP